MQTIEGQIDLNAGNVAHGICALPCTPLCNAGLGILVKDTSQSGRFPAVNAKIRLQISCRAAVGIGSAIHSISADQPSHRANRYHYALLLFGQRLLFFM